VRASLTGASVRERDARAAKADAVARRRHERACDRHRHADERDGGLREAREGARE
jgi:hypothetical protein